MNRYKIFFLLAVFFMVIKSYGQDDYEFFGVVRLNDNTIISYRMVFTETNGNISGFSVTDLQGEHETKNVIEGKYDKKTKRIEFKENDIIYTKSSIAEEDFCFLNFKGKLKLNSRKTKIEGDFLGFFSDGSNCINGSLKLIGNETLYKRLNKLNRKIKKTKRIDKKSKEKFNAKKMLDSLRINTLKANEVTSVFWKEKQFKMIIWDAGKFDGDKVSIIINGKPILKNYKISHEKKEIVFDLKKKINSIEIKAENLGEIAPNTAKVLLLDGDKEIGLYTNLDKGKSTKISVIRRKQ